MILFLNHPKSFLHSLVIPFIYDFQTKNKKIIHIKDSKREDLQDISQKTKLRVLSFDNLDEKADLIIGDFPFWQRGISVKLIYV